MISIEAKRQEIAVEYKKCTELASSAIVMQARQPNDQVLKTLENKTREIYLKFEELLEDFTACAQELNALPSYLEYYQNKLAIAKIPEEHKQYSTGLIELQDHGKVQLSKMSGIEVQIELLKQELNQIGNALDAKKKVLDQQVKKLPSVEQLKAEIKAREVQAIAERQAKVMLARQLEEQQTKRLQQERQEKLDQKMRELEERLQQNDKVREETREARREERKEARREERKEARREERKEARREERKEARREETREERHRAEKSKSQRELYYGFEDEPVASKEVDVFGKAVKGVISFTKDLFSRRQSSDDSSHRGSLVSTPPLRGSDSEPEIGSIAPHSGKTKPSK